MRIQVKGRNVHVSEDVREHVTKRFRKVEKQVSELAELEVELSEERNPAISDSSGDLIHSINLCADELAVQVKRHRDKRRKRRESRLPATEVLPGDISPAA